MKNRDYKQFSAGEYYHVFNRGNNKEKIFLNDSDCLYFVNRLRFILGKSKLIQRASLLRVKPLPEEAFSLICYCLMPNHYHLLLRQNSGIGVDRLISRLATSYSKFFNKKYDRVGQLFQDQFKAVRVDSDAYLIWLSAYIHLNPKIAEMVDRLEKYPWSSYLDYAGERNGTLCDRGVVTSGFLEPSQYRLFVSGAYEKIKERKELEHLLLD